MGELTGAFDPEWIRRSVLGLNREPFRERLARMLRIEPTDEALQDFANKSPDRYWQAVTQAARLAGFTERTEMHLSGTVGVAARLEAMSDAEVYAEAGAMGVLLSPATHPPKAPEALPPGPVAPQPVVVDPDEASQAPRNSA